jgi:hypothetical protein
MDAGASSRRAKRPATSPPDQGDESIRERAAQAEIVVASHELLVVNVVAFRNRRRKHLTPYFAGMKMTNISPSTINAHVAKRLKDTPTPANATVTANSDG